MRPMPDQRLEAIRSVTAEMKWAGFTMRGTGAGCFFVRRNGYDLRIIASDDQGEGWEHVSVSLDKRCPNWPEMCFVKDLFWLPEETVMQLHPPESEWVNNHPYCLHLWRPTRENIPLPPSIFVGVKSAGLLTPESAHVLREQILQEKRS